MQEPNHPYHSPDERRVTDEQLRTITIVSSRTSQPCQTDESTTAIGTCDDCGQGVWIAASSQRLIARAAALGIVNPVNCLVCALPKMSADMDTPGGAHINGPSAEQVLDDILGNEER